MRTGDDFIVEVHRRTALPGIDAMVVGVADGRATVRAVTGGRALAVMGTLAPVPEGFEGEYGLGNLRPVVRAIDLARRHGGGAEVWLERDRSERPVRLRIRDAEEGTADVSVALLRPEAVDVPREPNVTWQDPVNLPVALVDRVRKTMRAGIAEDDDLRFECEDGKLYLRIGRKEWRSVRVHVAPFAGTPPLCKFEATAVAAVLTVAAEGGGDRHIGIRFPRGAGMVEITLENGGDRWRWFVRGVRS